MEVPHDVVGRTRPSAQGLNYLQAADMTGLGRGIAAGLEAIGVSADAWKQRSEQTNRFSALSGFADLETRVVQSLTEAKRDSSIDVANFPQTAEGIYDNEVAAYLNSVPAELQDEFKFRTDQLKTKVMGDALEFQFTSQDQFFGQEITKNLDRARLSLSQSVDPTKDLAAWQERIANFIVTAPIPEAQKAQYAREANIALQGMVYKNEVKQQQLDRAHYNPAGSATGIAADILRSEEGFRSEPYDDGGTLRIGYGTDTVTREDGSKVSVHAGSRVSRDDAERDLARRIPEFENTAVEQVGADAWARLPANARGALISVTYNYGRLPSSVVRAIKGGDLHDIANAVAGLDANKKRRLREAAIIEGGEVPAPNLDNDERFSSLPFDQRQSLREDGIKEATAELTQQKAAEKDAYDQRLNSLLNGVLDGTVGKSDIDRAYDAGRGWLTNYEDRKKAIKLWEGQNEQLVLAGKAQAKLQGGGIWNPNSTEDKNMQNALFNQRGPEALAGMDQQYIYGLAALAARTHDIPTDAVGYLNGMSRSNDAAKAAFALNSLAILKEQAPDAFEQRVDDDLASKVDFWERRKDTVPQDELMERLRGTTTAERQQRIQLREDAQAYLRESKDKVKNVDKLVGEFVGSYNPWGPTGAPEVYGLPWAARGLVRDYQTAFVDAYEKLGNPEDAAAAATEQLKRSWGVTEIGGQRTLMKNPPQKAYPKMSGSYDWIEQEVRQTLAEQLDVPKFEDQFQLISDDQTEQEFDARRSDPNAPPPSYLIAVKTPHGWSIPNGGTFRMNFVPSQETVNRDEMDFKRANLEELIAERERIISTPTGLIDAQQQALEEVTRMKQELEGLPENPADYDPWYRNKWFSIGPFTLTDAQRKAAESRRKELENADR